MGMLQWDNGFHSKEGSLQYGQDGVVVMQMSQVNTSLQISSWTAATMISLIAIISWSRVFQWATKRCCSTPQQPVNRPQVIRPRKMAHRYRLLQDSDDNNNGNDVNDNDEPLPLQCPVLTKHLLAIMTLNTYIAIQKLPQQVQA